MSAAVAKTEGFFTSLKNHLPTLNKVMAIIILILNIFFPGIGTMCLACVGGSFQVEHLIVGLVQLLLAALIIGWVWSILWGVLVVLKSS